MEQSFQPQGKKFFESAPESHPSGRQSGTGSTTQRPGRSATSAMTGAELRLHGGELPERHRSEIRSQIRRRMKQRRRSSNAALRAARFRVAPVDPRKQPHRSFLNPEKAMP
jgi:hypothetical protein